MISNSEFNQKLLEKIGEHYPKKSQQLDFLMEKMSLGKESAYRRLRGDVPFSFTEACIVSEKLALSLDEIVMKVYKKERPAFLLRISPPEESSKDYTYYYKQTYSIYETMFERWLGDPTLTIYSASNTVPQALMLPYPYLSKFRAFTWQYQMHQNLTPERFSAITIPEELMVKQKLLAKKINQFPDTTLIISCHVFDTLVKLIQHFFSLNLLTREEVFHMKNELLELMQKIEYMTTMGKTEYNGKIHLYIADIDFDSNYTYVKGINFERSFVEMYFMNSVSTSNAKICHIQKEWIDSLKKYSTLIGTSDTMERTSFFDDQKELINHLIL